jgi:hypothetical protein
MKVEWEWRMFHVIQANSRVQFTAEDIEFILSVLQNKPGSTENLVRLLSDEDTRDIILDDEALLRAVLEQRNCLRISTRFYFYILVRHAFRRTGLRERCLADYVASVLAEFSSTDRLSCQAKGQSLSMDYFFEMLAALQTVDDTTRFFIRAHIGNHSLFLSGVFPDRIRFRAETRGCPNLSYYEGLGRSNFKVASDHRLARKYDLDGIFNLLAERFQETRLALNDLRDRLISLGEPEFPFDNLVKGSPA